MGISEPAEEAAVVLVPHRSRALKNRDAVVVVRRIGERKPRQLRLEQKPCTFGVRAHESPSHVAPPPAPSLAVSCVVNPRNAVAAKLPWELRHVLRDHLSIHMNEGIPADYEIATRHRPPSPATTHR